jgi:uncharacterized Ntn-hydrolase superfamily protein
MTYSIVARDPKTGQLGVAVQSHFFGVGRLAQWAEPGAGAVATQSFVEPSYGFRGLELMRAGRSAPDILEELLAADPAADARQVGMIDAAGRTAVHTGAGCVAAAGSRSSEQVVAQANMMERASSWEAMVDAYEGASGDLTDRLLAALDAAEAEGGDIRGRQSAVILVVAAEASGEPWKDVVVDVRVDDHPRPLDELRRLVDVSRVWGQLLGWFATDGLMSGELTAAPGDIERTLGELTAAQSVLGDNLEPTFWRGVLLARAGRLDEARSELGRAVASNPRFGEFLRRLPASGMLPDGLPESLL